MLADFKNPNFWCVPALCSLMVLTGLFVFASPFVFLLGVCAILGLNGAVVMLCYYLHGFYSRRFHASFTILLDAIDNMPPEVAQSPSMQYLRSDILLARTFIDSLPYRDSMQSEASFNRRFQAFYIMEALRKREPQPDTADDMHADDVQLVVNNVRRSDLSPNADEAMIRKTILIYAKSVITMNLTHRPLEALAELAFKAYSAKPKPTTETL